MIPTRFYMNAEDSPVARTVGELKELLEELPDDLPVALDFADSVELVVFNHGEHDQHLSFREPEVEED